MLVAFGWSNPRIAAVLDITHLTLRKHYRAELKQRRTARDRLNAMIAEKFWELFAKGNVRAGCEFRSMVEQGDAVASNTNFGKKERALMEAQRPDLNSPTGELLAARDQRNVGSELPGLGRSVVAWPVAHPRSSAQ
jgi:hypothetical protein